MGNLAFVDLTESKRAEAAQRESAELSRAIVEDSPDIIEALDVDGRLLMINKAGRRMLKFDGFVDPHGKEWRRLWPEAMRARVDDALATVGAGGMARFQGCCQTPNGTRKWWDVIVKPLRDDEGRVNRFLAVSRDISDIKQAEESLQANARQLASELDAMTRLQRLGALNIHHSDPTPIFQEIVDAAIAICGANFGDLQVKDYDSSSLKIVAQRGFPDWWVTRWNTSLQQGPCRAAFERGERVIIEDLEQCALLDEAGSEMRRKAGIRSSQSTPLISRSGDILGVFSTHDRAPQRPSEQALRLLDLLARTAADLIDHMHAEQALRQALQDFLRAQQVAQIGWWRLDFENNLISCSEENYRLLGLPQGSPISYETYLQIVHPCDRDDLHTRWTAAREGATFDVEHRIVVGGRVKWVRVKAYMECDANGAHATAFGVTQDITERKLAEKALRASEQRERLRAEELKTIFDTAPIGLAITLDKDLRHTESNRANGEIFEAPTISNNSGSPASRLLQHGREISIGELPMQRALQGDRVDQQIMDVARADGRNLVVLAKAAPLFDEEGTPRGAVGAFMDITELTKTQEALRESEERFRTLAQMSPDAILVCVDDRFVYANPEALRLLGAGDLSDVIGLTRSEIVIPENHELAREEYHATPEQKQVDPLMDHQWRRLDGSLIDVGVAMGPTVWHGKPALQLTARDIGERKKAEAALREADRRKDDFLAVLAHELRNPLAPIRNALYVIRKCEGEAETTHDQRRSLLAMMERQVEHLVRLVDDLLDISRINCGKIELKKERRSLAAILRQSVELAELNIETAGHRLTIDLQGDEVMVDADGFRLAQVFANLLNNSAKYTPPGGRIWLKAERVGEEAVVSVRDDGIGIAPDLLPRVFDLFTQADTERRGAQGGLGIGLALVRGLVNLHGGSVEGNSEGVGQGSEFIVRLPLGECSMNEGCNAERPVVAPAPKLRALVVDDDRDVADSFVMLLACLGVEVRAAYGGAAALAVIREFKPHLAFLDIGMPGMDGLETARRIRAEPRGKDIMLAALSGWGRDDDRRRAMEAGFDHHFVKPIEIDVLETLLASTAVDG
jgi:PAS domain S-box-containing protein